RYNPWDQRLCLIPDADLYNAITSGRAEVVTDHIDHFDATGIALKSGGHLDADIIVTATGLQLQALGGAAISL
ncbi:FAD-containing monooxygenase EthA, partial [Klebsiella pneumoniae]|nr:FAD-containing monooxygenase EthA [Klebsiella pneumoniae]